MNGVRFILQSLPVNRNSYIESKTMKTCKQVCLIALLWGIAFCPGNSQETRFGTLYTTAGDTLSGLIKKVMWNHDPKRINHFLLTTPDTTDQMWEAKAISWYRQGRDTDPPAVVFYGKVWPHNGLRQFLQPQVDGQAQLFVVPDPLALLDRKAGANRMVFDADFEEDRDDAYYVSMADTELLLRVEKDNYDLVLKQMLRDCPALTEQIGERKFRFNNLDRIIGGYNEGCE